MATALTRDFLVKSGLTVQGTSDVSSSTNSTQTLQVNGGASIAKKLYVGGDLNVSGGITFSGVTTSTGAFNILSTASATTAGLGALTVAGGGYFGDNLVVMGTAASTGTTSSNALYVAGGAGIAGSLVVGGVTLFKNDVTFSGTATYVYSTNTFYTDNILEVHVPPGGIYADWALDDGKDIGFRFHYYTPSGVSGTDTNAALVLSNSGNRMLEWYSSGAEGGTGQYSGAQYGGFKTGYIQLTTATAALATNGGAFQVVGGAGIGKDVYAGSTVSGATLVGRNLTSGRVAFVSTTTAGLLIDDAGLVYVPDADLLVTTVTLAQTATNIASGLAGDINMQTGAGLTSFIRAGSTGSILVSNGSTATFTSTGSIVIAWAAGSDRANAATNLLNGTAGQIPYQTGISTTGFIAVGTSGYILQSNGTAAPTWVASTATAAGTAITATNIGGGFATAIPYQSNTGTTNFDQAFRWDSTNAIARIANGIFTGTNVSTNTTTGALQVLNGGAGIGGNLNVGGGAGIGGNLNVGGGANIIGITTVTNATQSTTTNTGALQIVNGGAGIGGNLNVGGGAGIGGNLNVGGGVNVIGITTVTNTTNATSTTTGALQIVGGVGIGGDLWVGGNIYLDGVGLDTVYGTTATFTQIYATGTNVSGSTTTGALVVTGGVGIGGNLNVGGVLNTFNKNTDGIRIATNYVSGGNGTNDYGSLGFYGNLGGANDNKTGEIRSYNDSGFYGSLEFFVRTNGASAAGTDTTRLIKIGGQSNDVIVYSTVSSVSTDTGALQIVGGVGIGQALYVGGGINVGGNIIPTNNNISLGSSSSPFADIFLGANSLYIDTIKFSGTLTNLKLESSAGPVTLNAGAGIFTNTTNASSTITGAIQVVGGVGIGKNLYVGGNEVIFGDIEVRGGDFTTDNTTFNLINNIATTVNFAGSSTALTIGTSTGYVSIRSLESASSTTGALRVAGGVGIGGDLYVRGDFTTDNTTFNLINTNAATVNFAGSSTALTIGETSGYTNIRNVTTLTNATSATSTSTGALTVRGGVGIGGDLYIGGTGYINNNEIIHAGNAGNFGVSSIRAGTDTAVNTSSGVVTISNTSTLQTITNRGSTTTNVINITNTGSAVSTITGALRVVGGIGVGSGLFVGGISTFTNIVHFTSTASSANTTTGALRVIGGVGVGGAVVVGGTVTAPTFIGNLTGVATTATNIANGGPGQLIYQSSTGTTRFVSTGTVGQILISGGTDAAIFVNTSTFTIGYANNIVGGNTGTLVYQTAPNTTDFITTGSLYVGSAVTATNIVGGNIGSLPYQSNVGITTMLPLGNSGFLLTSNGTVPEWVGLGSLSAGTATNVSITSEVSTSNVHYITFVSTTTGAAGIRTSGPSGLTYIPSTGAVRISGATNITSNIVASSTITGALIVAGGVGIGGNLYIGGNTIETDEGTVSLLNGIATTVNFAGAGTIISIGANTGTTTVNNNLTVRGDLVVQGTRTVVDTTVTNFIDPIITLGGVANNGPYIIDTNQDKGIAFNWFDTDAKTGFFGYKDSLGFFTFIPDASFSGDVVSGTKGAVDAYLAGGASNSIVYQSAPNITAFLSPATTSGWVLASTGGSSAPTWIKVATEGATTSTNIGGGTRGQVPFQTNTGTTGFFGPGTTGNLLVSAGTTSTGPVFQNTLTLAGTTTSISTTTGALQVKGGIGVGGSVYVGNRIGWTSATNVSAVYQYYNIATNSLDTVFG